MEIVKSLEAAEAKGLVFYEQGRIRGERFRAPPEIPERIEVRKKFEREVEEQLRARGVTHAVIQHAIFEYGRDDWDVGAFTVDFFLYKEAAT